MQVLLYNFFQDSDVSLSSWRVVLNFIPGVVSDGPKNTYLDTRHNVVCQEVGLLSEFDRLTLYLIIGV